MLSAATRARSWARGLFLGWWVLAAAMGIQVLTANFTMQSFGAYIAAMRQEFGWSATAFAGAFAILQSGGGLLGPLIGWLLGRFGPRPIIRVGIVVFSLGVGLLSLVNSPTAFYLVVVVIAVGASLSGFLPLNTLAVNWFERRRSTALALMQTGISLGGLLVPLVAWSLAAYGWRATAVATALIVFTAGIPLTFLLGNAPEDYGLAPDGDSPPTGQERASERPEPRDTDFTAREALRTRAFWLIGFGHAIALTVVFAVLAHLVVYLTDDRGFSLQLAGTMVAVMTSMSIAGQLAGGFLGDTFDKRAIATLAMFGHAAGLLLLAYGPGTRAVLAFAVVHGLSWGLRGPIMQSIRADYFGRTHFGQIMGFSAMIVTLGTVLGPIVAGTLADATGGYRLGFTVLAVLAMMGSAFFVLATPPRPKRWRSEPR